MENQWTEIKKELKAVISNIAILLAVMWGVWIVDTFFLGRTLSRFGIHPREPGGLWGILFAPFLHGGFSHILGNTIGLIPLSLIVMFKGAGKYVKVWVIIMIVSGLGIWLTGAAHSNHIGASGVIFGLLGYLLSVGIVERKWTTILLSLATFTVYGGMLWGILPVQAGVSWEGHLFGFAGGVVSAFVTGKGSRSESRK